MHKELRTYILSKEGHRRETMINEVFELCMSEIEKLVPLGRELSLFREHIEQAHMFAIKAMASEPANHEPPPTSTSIKPEPNR